MHSEDTTLLLDGLLNEWSPAGGENDTGELLESRKNIMNAFHQGRIDGEHACSVCGMRHYIEGLADDCCKPALDLLEQSHARIEAIVSGYTDAELISRVEVSDDQLSEITSMCFEYMKEHGTEAYTRASGISSAMIYRLKSRARPVTFRTMIKWSVMHDIESVMGDDWQDTCLLGAERVYYLPPGSIEVKDTALLSSEIMRLVAERKTTVYGLGKETGICKNLLRLFKNKLQLSIKKKEYDILVKAGMEDWNE